jgi:hypothetical protein
VERVRVIGNYDTLQGELSKKWDEQVYRIGETIAHEKSYAAPSRGSTTQKLQGRMTIGIDLGDVWSHYCKLNEDGEVVGRGRFRTSLSGVEEWFTDLPPVRIAMEAGTHSVWISKQLQKLIVANVHQLSAISHSHRKSDQVDAEKWLDTVSVR